MIPEGYEKLAAIGLAYKSEYNSSATYKYLDTVFYSGSTFVALKDNPVKPPVSDGVNWQYLAQGFVEGVMSAINATDTSGVLGTSGDEVNAQALMDAIADRVMTKLIPTSKIVNNLLATDESTVLSAPQGKALSDSVNELNQKLPQRNYQIRTGSATINCLPNTISTLDLTSAILSAFGWTSIVVLIPTLHSSIPNVLSISNMLGVFYVYNNSAVQYDNVMIRYIATGK